MSIMRGAKQGLVCLLARKASQVLPLVGQQRRSYTSAFCGLQNLGGGPSWNLEKNCRKVLSSHTFTSLSYWANQKQTTYADDDVKRWIEEFPQLTSYDSSAVQSWRNAFDILDRDLDGYISQADLQKSPTFSLEKATLLKSYDRDQNNLIDFGEFVDAMYFVDLQGLRRSFDGFDPVDIQLEFEKFAVQDEDVQKKVIDLNGVRRLMRYHDFTVVNDHDAERLHKEMDTNSDGVVDLREFREWLCTPNP